MIKVFQPAVLFSKIFFPLYLLAGIFIFQDYGISWDEGINRVGTALPEYNYVFHGDEKKLLESSEKYHGPSFELLLLSAERIAHVTDTRSIYLLRHFITFFFFWLSALFLFLLARKVFISHWVAIACMLMYVLSPRIFGESFFNSKDIGCLSFFTISLYTLHRFVVLKTFWSGAFHALVTGFMIDIRITGLIMPFVTSLALISESVIAWNKKQFSWRMVLVFISYLFLQFAFIIFFWPVLWLGPVHHLHEAFTQMSNYPWTGNVIFMGNAVAAKDIPWYYLPLWIMISVPVFYTILFVCGVVFCVAGLMYRRMNNDPSGHFLIYAMTLALLPPAAVIFLHSVVYDGWRHLYFIYSPCVLVAGYGLEFLSAKLVSISQRRVLAGLMGMQFIVATIIMFRDHPHQHVYFNLPARLAFSPVTQKFDADFWALSYRRGLETILEHDTASAIHIRVENDPGSYNLEILPRALRDRFSIHGELHACDYWLAEFRGRIINPDKVNAIKIGEVNNSSGRLLTIYKGMRKETARELIFQTSIDFEDSAKFRNVSGALAASGKFCNELNANQNASVPVFYRTPLIRPEEVEEIQLQVKVNAATFNPNAMLVLKVMRNDSLVYWASESLQYRLNAPGKWENFKWNVTLIPADVMDGDVISAYVWNVDNTLLYVDDLAMAVVRYPVGKPVNYFPK